MLNLHFNQLHIITLSLSIPYEIQDNHFDLKLKSDTASQTHFLLLFLTF